MIFIINIDIFSLKTPPASLVFAPGADASFCHWRLIFSFNIFKWLFSAKKRNLAGQKEGISSLGDIK